MTTPFAGRLGWRYFAPTLGFRGGTYSIPELLKGYHFIDASGGIARAAAEALAGTRSTAGNFPKLWEQQVKSGKSVQLHATATEFAQQEILAKAHELMKEAGLTDAEARRRAIITFDDQGADGHCYVTVSFEPPGPRGVLEPSYRTLRAMVGGFFGQGYELPPEVVEAYSSALAASGPEAAARVLRLAAGDVTAFNADRFRDNVPYHNAMAQLGYSSDVGIVGHEFATRGNLVSTGALFLTSAQHIVGGAVNWLHLDTPEGRYLVQFGAGDHQIPGGNAFNTVSAGPTFKQAHATGCGLLDIHPSIVERYSQREADKLRLGNPMYWELNAKLVREGRYYLLLNEKILEFGDDTVGRFIALEHASVPARTAVFNPAEFRVLSADEVADLTVTHAEEAGERPPRTIAELPGLPAPASPFDPRDPLHGGGGDPLHGGGGDPVHGDPAHGDPAHGDPAHGEPGKEHIKPPEGESGTHGFGPEHGEPGRGGVR